MLYGFGLSNNTEVVLTSAEGYLGADCKSDDLHYKTKSYSLTASPDGTTGTLEIPGGDLPAIEGQEVFYTCLKTRGGLKFTHQGSESTSTQVRVKTLLLPIWFMVCGIVVLLCLSGLFSGEYTIYDESDITQPWEEPLGRRKLSIRASAYLYVDERGVKIRIWESNYAFGA